MASSVIESALLNRRPSCAEVGERRRDRGSMRMTERHMGGGVLGFAIAFIAFAFGGALGVPPMARLVVVAGGVLLAVLSAGLRGFGLAAVVLGGIVLVSSLSLFAGLVATRVLEVPPSASPTAHGPTEEDGPYILTLYDKGVIEAWWRLASTGERRALCGRVDDGITNADTKDWARGEEARGVPIREGENWKVRARAMLQYMAGLYCQHEPA
jgi:hypothetical protein